MGKGIFTPNPAAWPWARASAAISCPRASGEAWGASHQIKEQNILCIADVHELFIQRSLSVDGVCSPARVLLHLGIHQSREAMELGAWLVFRGVVCG